jgi:hypothetical protein
VLVIRSVNLVLHVSCSFHVFCEQAGNISIFQLDDTSTVNEDTMGEGHSNFTIRSPTLYFKANDGPSVDLLRYLMTNPSCRFDRIC